MTGGVRRVAHRPRGHRSRPSLLLPRPSAAFASCSPFFVAPQWSRPRRMFLRNRATRPLLWIVGQSRGASNPVGCTQTTSAAGRRCNRRTATEPSSACATRRVRVEGCPGARRQRVARARAPATPYVCSPQPQCHMHAPPQSPVALLLLLACTAIQRLFLSEIENSHFRDRMIQAQKFRQITFKADRACT